MGEDGRKRRTGFTERAQAGPAAKCVHGTPRSPDPLIVSTPRERPWAEFAYQLFSVCSGDAGIVAGVVAGGGGER
jgi:hypothetical protein